MSPPCNGGQKQGLYPCPLAGAGGQHILDTYCQLPCGLKVGNGRGWSSAPFLLALVPLHHITIVELRAGGPRSWSKDASLRKKKCSPTCPLVAPGRAGRYTDVSTQWAVRPDNVSSLGCPQKSSLEGTVYPKHLVQSGTSSSDDSHENMTDYLTFNHTCVLIYTFLV